MKFYCTFTHHKFYILLFLFTQLFFCCFSQPLQKNNSTVSVSRLYPKISAPTASLVIVDLQHDNMEGQIAATVLQGIVNRTSKEKIYVMNTYCEDNRGNWKNDTIPGYPNQVRMAETWLTELFKNIPQQRLLTNSSVKNPGIKALVKKYKPLIKGLIIFDPALEAATIEAATTIAGQTDGLVVSQTLAEELKYYKFPVIEDLRKQHFKNNIDCLNWLKANYFANANKQVAFTWSHMSTDKLSWGAANKDYVVANRLFTYYLDIKNREEMPHYADIIKAYPKGTPIMGWTDEIFADNLFAENGCFMVPLISVENMTVMSSFPAVTGTQPKPKALTVEKNGVYIAFYVADGDNLEHSLNYEPFTILNSSAYGKIPLTWIINPAIADLAPPIFNWYLSKLGNQELGAMMGDGSPKSDRYEGFKFYCNLARHYLDQTGITTLKQMAEGEAIAWNVQPGVLNSGYAGTDSRGVGPYDYHFDNHTFHIGSLHISEHNIENIIRDSPAGEPLFLNVFAGTAAGDVATQVKNLCDKLQAKKDGKKYFFIRSMDLAATYSSALIQIFR